MGARAKKVNRSTRRVAEAAAADRGDTVVLAWLHPGEVSGYFNESLLKLVLWDIGNPPRRVVNLLQEWSGANVAGPRNTVTRRFLDGGVGDWLLWIDSDMQFEVDAVERLLAAADPVERPIVGGLCFGNHRGELFPTIYQFARLDGGKLTTARLRDYPRDTLVQVAATGAAFLLIHRSVLERMEDHGFNATFPWFQETELDGDPVGEDLTFCLRAGMLGIPVHVDTRVKIGHHKTHLLTEGVFESTTSAPLPSDLGLVVPTRGDHPEVLAAVVAASGLPPERVVVVDTAGGLSVAGATVVEDLGPVNIHRWWNTGIDLLAGRGCTRVAVLNDDVVIGPETLPRMARGLGGATLALLDEPGPSGHCFVLNTAHGVRADESYRWYCGDLQLAADAEAARGVVRVDAWCLHMHPTLATEGDESLRAMAEADGALYDARHPKGTRWERIEMEAS